MTRKAGHMYARRGHSLGKRPVRRRSGRKGRAAFDFVLFMKKVGIVCGGLTGMWFVASGTGAWAWNKITEPVRAEAAVRAEKDSLLTDVISGVADEVKKLKNTPRR